MITWQIILYILYAGVLYSLLVIGFGFILRSVKFFNVAYGGAFLVGGYMMFLFYRVLVISFIPAIFLSLFISGLYLFLSHKFIFSFLINRKANNFVLLIASFGFLTATSSVLGMIFGSQATIIARRLSDIHSLNIFGGTLNIVEALAIIIIFTLICIFAFIYFKTHFGRVIRAVEDDSEVAELVGIPKGKIFSQLFFIGGALAGLGGIIQGLNVGIVPASGLLFMLPVIVISVLGGIRSFWGGIIGAFILAIAQKLTVVFFGGSWEQAVPFVILIIVLLVRPEGILKK
ncbi:hypothetical protein A3C67_02560 [Candidatus Nomurabacteria bacterium RIFCSPHIGHO2_02_FULL_42_19]|uniref:Branched-chain amino acid ABC transporter permease n=1 Tax=Candidatus Nomurabacteria bacterium RIFCSPHIGHO2_02_FULL_42_19 TaxID=1801756 RepID=A0A1F6W1G2_9BACT|nr:MAG: hypothetical protein A3C67_02560 [Candidatus Nomurabacteria bacterium RIFCSPHIGHO2_02_FULL_42_19]